MTIVAKTCLSFVGRLISVESNGSLGRKCLNEPKFLFLVHSFLFPVNLDEN